MSMLKRAMEREEREQKKGDEVSSEELRLGWMYLSVSACDPDVWRLLARREARFH